MSPVIESIVQTLRALSPECQQEVLDFADFLAQKSGKVVIRDVPKQRTLGLHEGKGWLSDDFNDPLPDDFWLGNHESVA
ncbi:DUF2281 domain-containing protein [Nodosilinea sp. P-1105]|nr:DUF2281 domain-containing protein [Nodosilinea sp. P-1105]